MKVQLLFSCLFCPLLLPFTILDAQDLSRKDTIALVQQALIDQGFTYVSVDSVVGPATIRAIKVFQRMKGLAVNGNLTSETLDLLVPPENPVKESPSIDTSGWDALVAVASTCILVVGIIWTAKTLKKRKSYAHFEKKLAKAEIALSKGQLGKVRSICDSVIKSLE